MENRAFLLLPDNHVNERNNFYYSALHFAEECHVNPTSMIIIGIK